MKLKLKPWSLFAKADDEGDESEFEAEFAKFSNPAGDGDDVDKPGDEKEEPAVDPVEQLDNEPPAEDKPEDIWADATEAQRNAFEQQRQQTENLNQRVRSDDGRVAAYQRQVSALQQDLAAATAKHVQAANPGDGAAPTEQEIKDALADPEAMDAFREEWPDIAGPVEQMLNSRLAAIEEKVQQQIAGSQQAINQSLEPIQAERAQQARQQEAAALEAAHPNWMETVRSAEFGQWLQQQPQAVQQLTSSEAASDAAYLIAGFKQSKGITPSSSDDDLAAKRQRQLERSASATTPAGSPRANSKAGDGDFDGYFNAFAKKRSTS